MKRFVEGEDRRQGVLLPEYLDDFVAEENQVRVIEAFVDEVDLRALGFEGVVPETTGRPAYHPATMLMIYVYGYINQVQSSRRLERETARNVEMMWLTGRLMPDFKTIADFRKDNGPAIRSACRQFVALCRGLNLFAQAIVSIDGGRFKAVNSRDRSFSRGSLGRRRFCSATTTCRRRRAMRRSRPIPSGRRKAPLIACRWRSFRQAERAPWRGIMARADSHGDRPAVEVADVLRRHGEAYLRDHAGHLGRVERRVIGAITACRTATLGGHVEACDDCGTTRVAYNSCLMGRSSNGELACWC